jgi:H+/Cl- antiporter ClcA
MAKLIGQGWASSRAERRMMITGGASAGLAAAFNAPLAGAMFALEEIYKYLSPTLLVVIVVSAMTGDFVSKLAFGLSPVFSFETHGEIPLRLYWLLILLGVLLGGMGALYNFTLLRTQRCSSA